MDSQTFFFLLWLSNLCFLIMLQPEAVIDMKQRYVGHCNVGTDIKQASFLGQKGTVLQYWSFSSVAM